MSALARPIRPLIDPSRRLQARVDGLVLARRRAESLRFGLRGVAIGGFIAFFVGSAARILNVEGGLIAAVIILLAPVIAFATVGWFRQPTMSRITLEIDRRLGLDERVTTALELTERARVPSGRAPRGVASGSNQFEAPLELSTLAERQILETLSLLNPASTGEAYPLTVSRRALGLAALALVLAMLPWVVAWPVLLQTYLPPSPVALTAQSEADRLDAVARQLESKGSPTDPVTRAQVAAQLRNAADSLRQSGGNAQRATSALQRAEQATLAAGPQTTEDASQTLARIADALNGDAQTQAATRALDNQDPNAAAAALSQLAAKASSMSPSQRNSLASALQAASSAARGSDTSAADQLQQAADAAKNGDANGMQQAAAAIQQLGTTSTAQRDVAQARSELQSSRGAISQAAQNGPGQSSAATLGRSGSSSQASTGAQPNGTSSGQASASTQPPDGSGATSSAADAGAASSNSQSGSSDQQGGGIGKGSTDHLGASHDTQALAQRQIEVPTNQNGDPTSVGLSNQTQSGVGGTAQVDYANVLPQYRDQALQTIEGNVVPSGLKQLVKGYFDSLAPK